MNRNESGSECLSLPNSLHPLSEHLPEGIEKNGNHVNTIAKKMHFPHSFLLHFVVYHPGNVCDDGGILFVRFT